MKIYIVQSSTGVYEDYFEKIEKIFLDESRAIEFMSEYNKNLLKNKAKNDKLAQRGLKCDSWLFDAHNAVVIEQNVEE